jgi:hypothetical protein
MGAEFRIESLHDAGWEAHGTNYNQAVAARDHFATEIQNRLGPELAADVQHHVDVALGRLRGDELPDLPIAAERAFHQLLALERAVLQIEARIEAGCVFFDPYIDGLFLMSFWGNVISLLAGQESPGFMRRENIVKFLAMVVGADQRLPKGSSDHNRRKRQELIEFLERAIALEEPIWCDL